MIIIIIIIIRITTTSTTAAAAAAAAAASTTTTIALKGAIRDFYNLTAPRTVSNSYAEVAWAQSCANHVQHIERLSRATCSVPRGTKGQLSYWVSQGWNGIYFSFLFYWLKPWTDEGWSKLIRGTNLLWWITTQKFADQTCCQIEEAQHFGRIRLDISPHSPSHSLTTPSPLPPHHLPSPVSAPYVISLLLLLLFSHHFPSLCQQRGQTKEGYRPSSSQSLSPERICCDGLCMLPLRQKLQLVSC